MATFERVLWRVLRGNLYMNVRSLPLPPSVSLLTCVESQYAEIDDSALPVPSTEAGSSAAGEEKKLRKNVFIIFAHGQELLDKIRKIAECSSFSLVSHLRFADAV